MIASDRGAWRTAYFALSSLKLYICLSRDIGKTKSPRPKPWALRWLFRGRAYGDTSRKKTFDPGATVTGKLVTVLDPGTLNQSAGMAMLTELLWRM